MRNGCLLSLALLLVTAGIASAQAVPPAPCDKDIMQENSLPGDTTNAFESPDPELCSYFWVSGEWLYWWASHSPFPGPLLSTNSIGNPGVLGQVGTSTIAGGQHLDDGFRSGARLTVGWCIEGFQMLGIESSTILLGDRGGNIATFASDFTGTPVISRPVFNTAFNQESVEHVAFPGQFAGNIRFDAHSSFWGSDVNLIYRPYIGIYEYPEFIFGARYLSLDEDFTARQESLILPAGRSGFLGNQIGGGNTLVMNDSFSTRNRFVGGTVGMRRQFDRGCFFLNLMGTVSIGATHEKLLVDGDTTVNRLANFPPITTSGGVLALATNIGKTTHNEFTAVPEVRIQLGLHITKSMQFTVGYNFLYWGTVLRPGLEVDRRINPHALPTSIQFGQAGGPTVPEPQLRQGDFALHGLSAGLAFRF